LCGITSVTKKNRRMIRNICAGNKVLQELWFQFCEDEVVNKNDINHTIACPEDASEGGRNSKLQRVAVNVLNGQLQA